MPYDDTTPITILGNSYEVKEQDIPILKLQEAILAQLHKLQVRITNG